MITYVRRANWATIQSKCPREKQSFWANVRRSSHPPHLAWRYIVYDSEVSQVSNFINGSTLSQPPPALLLGLNHQTDIIPDDAAIIVISQNTIWTRRAAGFEPLPKIEKKYDKKLFLFFKSMFYCKYFFINVLLWHIPDLHNWWLNWKMWGQLNLIFWYVGKVGNY